MLGFGKKEELNEEQKKKIALLAELGEDAYYLRSWAKDAIKAVKKNDHEKFSVSATEIRHKIMEIVKFANEMGLELK